ncbi:MAG: MarR family transcriptional regulator [Lactobacillus sp.]|jgi:MarR family transcriptional regulator for hemolysin|nr:MarR family transcriptional regulator [Lactobacillus sp.]
MFDSGEVDSTIATINTLAHRLQLQLDDVLRPLNLNASNYYFILKIDQAGMLTQDQLFKKIFLNQSNVTRRLQQLIHQDLVVKERSKTDGRAWEIKLTAKGQALVAKVTTAIQAVNDLAFQQMSPTDIKQLIDLLAKIELNLRTKNGAKINA